jgi:uncharacterized membrane protein
MALSDFFSNFHLFARWLHVFAGIFWMGCLYFFNFINSNCNPPWTTRRKKRSIPS